MSRKTSKLLRAAVLMGGLLVCAGAAPSPAQAVPSLQMYIEGASYCALCPGDYTDSWAIDGMVGLRLWLVADTRVNNVSLLVTWNDIPGNNPQFIFTGVKVGDDPTTPGIIASPASAFPGLTDDISAIAPTQFFAPGVAPLPIPAAFNQFLGPGRTGVVALIGDMGEDETPKFDIAPGFLDGFPLSGPDTLMINAYDITFGPPALTGQVVNFSLWGCEPGATAGSCRTAGSSQNLRLVFAPNSHDAQWRQVDGHVPEPGSLLLLGLGLVGVSWFARTRGGI